MGDSSDRGGPARLSGVETTPGPGEYIRGVILYGETIRPQKKDGTPFVKAITEAGIIPGIKVDTGAKDLAAHPERKQPKVWTDCATASKYILKWEPVLPSGAR